MRLEPARETPEPGSLVSLLFFDLVGSTALGERLDPEAFRHVQLRYYATCEEALHRHRGTIEKFIGDAVMCVFGIPSRTRTMPTAHAELRSTSSPASTR